MVFKHNCTLCGVATDSDEYFEEHLKNHRERELRELIDSRRFIKNAVRTESNDFVAIRSRLQPDFILRLLHGAMGLVTEAAELMDALKTHIYYGKPLDHINLREEVGDGFWYAAIIADTENVTFEEIQERIIAKLRVRFPQKFDEQKAVNRDLESERKVL